VAELQPLGSFNRVMIKAALRKLNEVVGTIAWGNVSHLSWEGYLFKATGLFFE